MKNRFPYAMAVVAILLLANTLSAQCLNYPISFEERLTNAQHALLGRVIDQHCYKDAKGNIYTANRVEVTAWVKSFSSATQVVVLTYGGIIDSEAQITFPAVQLHNGAEYFFMLEGNNEVTEDKQLRTTDPHLIQSFPFADAQGAWMFQDRSYHDVFTEGEISETDLLQRINQLVGSKAIKPDGNVYTGRVYTAARGANTLTIGSFAPNPTNAGTVNPADYLTINGSGFGAAPGRVEFRNADNGGSTFMEPPNASDYVSWTDNQIVVKVPTGANSSGQQRNAGTGTFRVVTANEETFESSQPLTVRYSHISVNSSFSGFATPTRQRYYLRNRDGLGGYTFLYNNVLAANTAAVNAFERALATWTCNTGINWRTQGVTTAGSENDDINIVIFDASLPSGVLARASSRLSGFAIPGPTPGALGSCDLSNTVWFLKEVDIQIQPNINWQYGPATATAGQIDFETIVLHELGHGHGLGHRIAPGQLMNFSVSSGVNIRIPAPAEVEGGLAKMSYSTTPTCFNPSGSGTPMIAAACPLPVKLISFTGEVRSFGAELKWKTAAELDVGRYEVQRSTNGIDFITIGSTKAKGSQAENVYQFIDVNLQKGVNYYRLKIIDKDGTFEYSAVITLKLDHAVQMLSVFPNPVRHELQVNSTRRTSLNLFDATGKLVKRLQVVPGNNRLDVTMLSNGVYYLADDVGNRLRTLVVQ